MAAIVMQLDFARVRAPRKILPTRVALVLTQTRLRLAIQTGKKRACWIFSFLPRLSPTIPERAVSRAFTYPLRRCRSWRNARIP